MMKFVGIDPGKSGALAVIETHDGQPPIISTLAFDPKNPNVFVSEIHSLSYCASRCFVVVENVHAMPKQGVSSSFNFGRSFGWILGLLDLASLPYELVNPQKWKKEFSCTSDKNTSIAVAKRLFPTANLMRTERCTTPHDGICEALLMAEYGRRRYGI